MKASRFIKLRTGHKLAIGAGITVVMAALTLLPQAKEFFQGMENRMQDFIYFFRESLPVEDTRALPIVMVFVDEKSLDQEKYRFRQPTPRKLLADVVRDLNTLGAKCIGLDFMFLRKHWEEQDQALLTALKESKAPVVTVKALPKLFEKKIDDPETFKDAKRLGILESLAPHTLLGFSEVIVGSRGIARYMVLGDDRRDLGGFAPVLFKTCLGQPVKLPGFVDPQKMKLLYYGPPTRLKTPLFNVIAAHELAQLAEFARKDAEMPSPVRGKIVLVGSGAETLRDTFPSPFSVVMEADPGDPTVSGKSGKAPEFVDAALTRRAVHDHPGCSAAARGEPPPPKLADGVVQVQFLLVDQVGCRESVRAAAAAAAAAAATAATATGTAGETDHQRERGQHQTLG